MVCQLRKTAPRVILDVFGLLQQDVGDVVHGPVGILCVNSRFSRRKHHMTRTDLFPFACETIEFEVSQEEPSKREAPFRALVVLRVSNASHAWGRHHSHSILAR